MNRPRSGSIRLGLSNAGKFEAGVWSEDDGNMIGVWWECGSVVQSEKLPALSNQNKAPPAPKTRRATIPPSGAIEVVLCTPYLSPSPKMAQWD